MDDLKKNRPKIVALVPLKINSSRLPNKNFLKLGDKPLASHVFSTLLQSQLISDVFCYTSQAKLLDLLPNGVKLLSRPDYLDGDSIKGNELFSYAIQRIEADIIVLSHVTAPFIKLKSIEKGINAILNQGYACSFSVVRQQTYCWYKNKPINYNPEKMDQTQHLDPVFTETNGFYVFYKKNFIKNNNRTCKKPFLVEVDIKEAIDIDYLSEYNLAKKLLNFNLEHKPNLEDLAYVQKLKKIIKK